LPFDAVSKNITFTGTEVNQLVIAIGSDHGGFLLKEDLKRFLQEEGIEFQDFGAFSQDAVDYPDVALAVGKAVAAGECAQGVLICGTGNGINIAANKIDGIRATLCHDVFSARLAREHNDSNILTMGGRVIGYGLAREILKTWLAAEFAGGRHSRRLEKIREIEERV
jgi:ribose 5-phosphate isomerase B